MKALPCLNDDEVVALIDGRSADRARHLAHLDACASCRELVGAAAYEDDARAPRALGPGDEVGGRYVIREPIGAGAMGIVYRATDPRLSRDVAVKLIAARPDAPRDAPTLGPRASLDATLAPRVLAEAHALARLSHPNVVAIHDVGTHGDRVFLAMELARETFATWLHRERRAPREVLRLLRQAGEGLAAAHATGLVHRDVKPDNIVIGFDDRAAISDFGLAQPQAPIAVPRDAAVDAPTMTSTGALIGTPAYMAPEQLRGQLGDDKSDQFAYCATIFEALSGARPFAGRSVEALREAASRGQIERAAAKRLPGWVRRIVLRGLRGDPEARWPSLRALLDALGRGPPLGQARVIVASTIGVAVLAIVGSLAWGLRETAHQRARAERRFDDVRQLATSLLFELHGAIEPLPGATKARALVVERAKRYLEILARDAAPGEPAIARELASAYEALADIQGGANASLGDTAEARASLFKALALREQLAGSDPDNADDAHALANALTSLGLSEPSPLAVRHAARALQIYQRLADAHPGETKTERRLANAHLTFGMVLSGQHDFAGAAAQQRIALAMWERQLAAAPSDPAAQRNVALASKYLAGQLQRVGDLAAATKLVARAVALDEARVASDANDHRARLDLSYSYGSLGYNQRQLHDLAGALTTYEKALALRATIVAADPANATAARGLGRAEAAICGVLRELGRVDEALRACDRALAHFEALWRAEPGDSDKRVDLAGTHSDLALAHRALAERTTAAARSEHLRIACEHVAQTRTLAMQASGAPEPAADPSLIQWISDERARCAAPP